MMLYDELSEQRTIPKHCLFNYLSHKLNYFTLYKEYNNNNIEHFLNVKKRYIFDH